MCSPEQRLCGICNELRERLAFKAREWNKQLAEGTRACRECSEIGNSESDTELRSCTICHRSGDRTLYSKKEWKNTEARKCYSCRVALEGGSELKDAAGAVAAPHLTTATGERRTCAKCEWSLPKDKFRAREWRKLSNRKCLDCTAAGGAEMDAEEPVDEPVQDEPTRECSCCGRTGTREIFSKREWKNEIGICTQCKAAALSLASTEGTHTEQAPSNGGDDPFEVVRVIMTQAGLRYLVRRPGSGREVAASLCFFSLVQISLHNCVFLFILHPPARCLLPPV